ncbi:MAG: aldo/keto reductase, partial [Clostridia bacterium]|nr:aldo/keto reductase [Clostridia bacterium]
GVPADSRLGKGWWLADQLDEKMVARLNKLNEVAAKRGQKLSQMALSWVYSKDGITSVLIGASKPQQILENIKMSEKTVFSQEELDMIDEIAS